MMIIEIKITKETEQLVKKVNLHKIKFGWKDFLFGIWLGTFLGMIISLLIV